MKLRTFLKLLAAPLMAAPLGAGCVHFVGNSPEEIKHREHPTFKVGDRVLVVTPLREGRNFDFGPGYLHSLHPTWTTWCVRFERGYRPNGEPRNPKFGHYKPEELVLLKGGHTARCLCN